MPKNNDNFRSKSTRKPLRDVTNARFKSSNKSVKKKSPDTGEDQVSAGDSLDRLILVHSDLSVLVRQIDELVVQALNLKVTSNNERKEIESFANVLSQIQTSLKPWVPRFQKALSNHSTRSENPLEVCLANQTVHIDEGTNEAPKSPDETIPDSLVSPSPLVSWRAECTTEGGKQLFLLTPLPTKAFSSRLQRSSRPLTENIAVHAPIPPPSDINPGGTRIDLYDGVDLKPISDKLSDPLATHTKSTQDFRYVSPERFSKRNSSMVVMTPCLKMSPPKSCILLEPISEYCHKNNFDARKVTSFPVGAVSQNFDASCCQASEHLALKYPDIFGVKAAHKLDTRRKTIEESPNWFISPPKTCILLEPPEDKQLTTAAVEDIQTNLTLLKESDTQHGQIPTKTSRNEVIEQTPMWKDPDSTIQRGKQHPGENTLKKELWTQFEAATTHGSRFKVSAVKESSFTGKDKGFLDLLEEASCDETNSVLNVRFFHYRRALIPPSRSSLFGFATEISPSSQQVTTEEKFDAQQKSFYGPVWETTSI